MTRKYSDITQYMANIYPEWSVIREDRQSLGQRILNCYALEVEKAAKELKRATSNFHVVTSNLDEIDWVYKVDLGSTFDFELNTEDPFVTNYEPPTLSGLIDTTYYPVAIAENNDIETFWYDHLPDRISLGISNSGEYTLLNDIVDNMPFSGLVSPHLDGHLFIEASGGANYINLDDEFLTRGEVIIQGETRKGTYESETIVFPWDMNQRTMKEWHSIDKVTCTDMPEGVQLTISSADVANEMYQDFWNLRHSEGRKKIDFFWGLGSSDYGTTLNLLRYSTDSIRDLICGLYNTYDEYRWELLNASGENLEIIDIAQQPFTNNIWGVSESKLYCFENGMTTITNFDYLKGMSSDSYLQIDIGIDSVIRGEGVSVDFVNKGALSPISYFMTSITYPDLTVSGILHNSLISYDPDNWESVTDIKQLVDNSFEFTPDQLGEHLFTFKAKMEDGTIQTQKRILSVDSKIAQVEFDLPTVVSGVIGIDFDSDQNMWIYTSGLNYQINLHHDVMLVDYDNKQIYLRESYDEVSVWQ